MVILHHFHSISELEAVNEMLYAMEPCLYLKRFLGPALPGTTRSAGQFLTH